MLQEQNEVLPRIDVPFPKIDSKKITEAIIIFFCNEEPYYDISEVVCEIYLFKHTQSHILLLNSANNRFYPCLKKYIFWIRKMILPM